MSGEQRNKGGATEINARIGVRGQDELVYKFKIMADVWLVLLDGKF